jgi:cytoskeletal protein CcmA (bactofilin family)
MNTEHLTLENALEEAEIKENTFIEGDLLFESNLVIRGRVKGKLTCHKTCIIEETADVDIEEIRAQALIIKGKLESKLIKAGTIIIKAGGKLTTQTSYCSNLKAEQGSSYTGNTLLRNET